MSAQEERPGVPGAISSGEGMPGLRRFDHVGITVPDLDEAHDFLVNVLGCEFMYRLGPFKDDKSDWMTTHLNVPADTVMQELRFYSVGGTAVFEVFKYEHSTQKNEIPRNLDIGGHHVALYVDDLDAAVAHLRAKGVEVLGEPTASSSASYGQRWIYFLAPWGLQFELVSYPQGKAFDQPGWKEAHPDELRVSR